MSTPPLSATDANVEGMPPPRLLDMDAIAAEVGLSPRSIRNYHQTAEQRRRDGAVRPGDFPPPDMLFGRSPVWKASTIHKWKRNRPGRGAGGGRPRKDES